MGRIPHTSDTRETRATSTETPRVTVREAPAESTRTSPRTVLRWLDEHFEETILVFLLVCIACVELAQVVIRNVPFIPALTWAEEFCRFCWIATVFISLPYTIRMGSMLRVTVLVDALPSRARSAANIAVDLVNAFVMGFLGYCSAGVVQRIVASGETSPAMLWPMWTLYAIMMAGFVLGCLRAFQQAVRHIRHFGDDDAEGSAKGEAEMRGEDPVLGEDCASDGVPLQNGASAQDGAPASDAPAPDDHPVPGGHPAPGDRPAPGDTPRASETPVPGDTPLRGPAPASSQGGDA